MLKTLIEQLRKYNRTEIAYKAGVSPNTLALIMSGKNDNPTLKTVEALQKFVKEKENEK